MQSQYSETKRRSLVKSVTWKVIATAITFFTLWFFTKEIIISAGITAVEASIGLISFFIHERAWNKVSWGKYEKNTHI